MNFTEEHFRCSIDELPGKMVEVTFRQGNVVGTLLGLVHGEYGVDLCIAVKEATPFLVLVHHSFVKLMDI